MTARLRRAPLALATILLLCSPGAACAAPSGAATASRSGAAPSPAQRLADAYAPIAMLREQRDPPCDTSAEQYQPTGVGTVLDNPTVTLRRELPDGSLEDVKRGPSAADVAGLPDGYYLDLRGEALGDTCVYARDFAQLVREGRAPAIVYAHIAREAGHPGFVLQYWFFWYFNQFNDLHEGDWEGMQLSFEAASAAQALREEPHEIILFQHAGGERASWSDAKVKKEGTHPIVYPAAGSHATFYDSAVYIENGQEGSGVGCDNTSEPLRELRLRPVLLPNRASERGRFRWLSYEGRWGEREKGFNNGPTGPVTKTVWKEPFAWMAGQRSSSPRLPGGSIAGPQVTKAFCGAVATASDFINLEAKSRPAAIATALVAVLLVLLLAFLVKWSPVDLEQLRAKRSFGQLIRAARRLYGHHWRVLVPIALAGLVIVGGTNMLANLLAGSSSVSDAAGRSGVNLALADLVETIARPIAMAVVAATVIAFVRTLEESGQPSFRASLAGMRARFWRVVGASLLATLGVTLMAITVIGIPWALWKLVGWAFAQQEVMFTGKPIRKSLRGSSAVVRGSWWRAARTVLFLTVLSLAAGPVLTFALIFTSLPLLLINLLGALIFSLLIPYVAIGETLLYFDLKARAEA